MIVTLTPNPSVDWTLEVPTLTRGRVHRITEQRQEPSGKGVNVTRALVANGVPSLAVLPIGGSEGAKLTSLLREENVGFLPVSIQGAVRVNISLTEPDGTSTKVNASGPTLTLVEVEQLVATVREAIDGADWVVGSGSLPQGVGAGFYADIGECVHEAGTRFALDSSGAALIKGLATKPNVIKPNVEELGEAAQQPIRTIGDAVLAAQELMRRGAVSVLVSLGPDGALLVSATELAHAEARISAPRSTVGAGDALLAGFLAAGGDGVTALREAVAWGAAAVSLEGSRVPPVNDGNRDAVQVHSHVDLDRALCQPSAPGRPATAR